MKGIKIQSGTLWIEVDEVDITFESVGDMLTINCSRESKSLIDQLKSVSSLNPDQHGDSAEDILDLIRSRSDLPAQSTIDYILKTFD